jgi:two-component system, chemotaxis family, sensor kinase CheA
MYDEELLKEFIIESNEHLAELEESLNRILEEPQNKEVLNQIFRSIHSIKGSANYIGLVKLGDFLHVLEGCLERVRQGKIEIDREIIDVLFSGKDAIDSLLKDLSTTGEELTDTDPIVATIRNVFESLDRQGPEGPAGPADRGAKPEETPPAPEGPATRADIFDEGIGEIVAHHIKDLERGLATLEGSMTIDELNRFLGLVSSFSSSIEYFGYDELKNVLAGMRNSALVLVEEGENINSTELLSFYKALDHIKDFVKKHKFMQQETPKRGPKETGGDLSLDQAVKEFTIIPGVGGSKVKLLYKAGFRSIESLRNARIEELESVNGISLKLAKDIVLFFKEDRDAGRPQPAKPRRSDAPARVSPVNREVVEDVTAGHDEELIDIFLSATVDLFSIIDKHQQKIRERTADRESLSEVLDVLGKLRRSAHYMEYDAIVGRLDSIRALIDTYIAQKGALKQADMDLLVNGLNDLKSGLRKSVVKAKTVDAARPEEPEPTEDEELLEIFISAADQHLDTINTCISHIKQKADVPESIEVYRKALESLKSSAKFMGYDSMIETVDRQLAILGDGSATQDDGRSILPDLEESYAKLKGEIGSLTGTRPLPPAATAVPATTVVTGAAGTGGGPSPEPAANDHADGGGISEPASDDTGGRARAVAGPGGTAGGEPPGDDGEPTADIPYSRQTLRVETERVDTIMNLVGELVVNRATFSQLTGVFREVYRELYDLDKLNKRELSLLRQLALNLESSAMELGRISNDLQEGVMRVRMVGINQLFSRFPRLVRDLADAMDKDIKLVITGRETELDKSVIEEIGDPLIHIIRNSIDHGIETREERKKKKKPEEGTLAISAYHQGNQVIIDISDDGKGIDLDEVKKRMVSDGEVAAPELARVSDREALDYLFRPGISMARKVSKVSGRGVGLDIVKRNIEKLKGTVEVTTSRDIGTSFTIKMPLTLAIIQALIVGISDRVYAIPLVSIIETVRIGIDEIETIEGHQVLRIRDKVLPLIKLSEIFKVNMGWQTGDASPPTHLFIVILSAEGREVGLMVDNLIGEENIVIKSLEKNLANTKGVSGASIMGDGSISLILDVIELVNLAIEREKTIRKHQALERYKPKRKPAPEQPEEKL